MSKTLTTKQYLLESDTDRKHIIAANMDDARKQAVNWMKETRPCEGNQYLECSIHHLTDRFGRYIESVYHMIPGVEPPCSGAKKHEWVATHEKEGGLKTNPGVWVEDNVIHKLKHCTHCTLFWEESNDQNTEQIKTRYAVESQI